MLPGGFVPVLAQGCAMCKTALEQDGGAGLIRGFYLSIVMLVSLPLLMAGTFAFLLWRAAKAKQAEAALAGGPPAR